MHAAAFKLEDGFGFATLEQGVGFGIVKRNIVEAEVFLPFVAAADELAGNFHDGEGGQTQKIELDQANGFYVVFVKLAHCRVAARLLV